MNLRLQQFSTYLILGISLTTRNLNRTITKYGSDEWNHLATSNRIVELLSEHILLLQTELDDVNTGRRKLTNKDILGPKERERRRLAAASEGKTVESNAQLEANLKYFDEMEKEHRALKERRMKQAQSKRQSQRKEERAAERKRLRNHPASNSKLARMLQA